MVVLRDDRAARAVLSDAYKIIENPVRWGKCDGSMPKKVADGSGANSHKLITVYTVDGAIHAASREFKRPDEAERDAEMLLCEKLEILYTSNSLRVWNNKPERTHREVLEHMGSLCRECTGV